MDETDCERVDRWLSSRYHYNPVVATEEITQQFLELIEEMKSIIRHQYSKHDDGHVDDYRPWVPAHTRVEIDHPSRISARAFKTLTHLDMCIGQLAARVCF